MFPGFAKHGKKMTRMHISQMHQSGTGVAFAPTSCGVAFAPTQGGGRGESFPAQIVSHFMSFSHVTCSIHFNQLPRRSGCYVVTSF